MNRNNERFKYLTVMIIGFIIMIAVPEIISAAPIRAGVSKINITKDNPTSLVNDPLYARALVLDDGKRRVVIISMDIVNIGYSDLNEIRTRLQN